MLIFLGNRPQNLYFEAKELYITVAKENSIP
jgi:hypothetical protein